MLQQCCLNLHRVSAGQVNFVNSHNNRHFGCLSMTNSLNSLRHDSVISGNNQNHNIRNLRTTRTHFRECLVTRRINKCNLISGLNRNLISTDMLRNTTGFMRCNVCLTQSIQQRSFTMVNVSHNRNHRSSGLHIFRLILATFQPLLNIAVCHTLNSVAHFFNHDLRRISVYWLVNGSHNAQRHQFLNNIGTLFCHTVSQFLNCNNFRNNHIFNNFFLRLLRLNRLRLFFLKAPSRSSETIIIVIIINGTDIMQTNFAAATLRFKATLHNFFALLFKSLFTSQRFF